MKNKIHVSIKEKLVVVIIDIKCCDGFYCNKYPNGLGTCKDCKDRKCGIFSFSECCKNMECTSFWYGDCI